jgi:sigma-B regulation protein RsbU (phosphoserine phosphatase)
MCYLRRRKIPVFERLPTGEKTMSELWLKNALEANTFLNTLFDNLNSGIFIVDQEARVRQVNRVFEKLFAKSEEEVEGQLCGNAIGCIFPTIAGVDCGTLAECESCRIRGAIVKALSEKVSTDGELISRSFIILGKIVPKHLLFSVKYITFNGKDMVVIIVDDITETETRKQLLKKRQRMLEKDLEAAVEIQRSLLPREVPKQRHFSFAWKYEPCGSVGGDIFNLVPLDEDRIIVYMVDVSGHGVPAALVTVSITQFIQHYISRQRGEFSPRRLLRQLDLEYPYERFNAYFTMICLLLDGRRQNLVYANAGHPVPVKVDSNGNLRQLEAGAAPVGMSLLPFSEEQLAFEPGDLLFCHTDGINEYRNQDGENFGYERLYRTTRQKAAASPPEVVDEIYRVLTDFSDNREADDDITMLALKMCPDRI